MRKLLYGLVGVVVVAVAGVLVLPSLIDLRALVQPVLQSVKDQTGREVRIGSVGLSLLPPSASVGDLTVANIPGAANPDMVRVKSVQVQVGLLALLSGRVEISSIAIVDPVIAIETLKDGRSSLDFPKGQAAAPGKQTDVKLEQVTVKNGLVILRDAAGGERRIEAVDATASAYSLSGPFRVKGSAKTAGVPVNLDVATARLEPGKPATANIALDGAGAKAQFQGTVAMPANPGPTAEPAIAGKFALNIANLSAFADQVNAGGGALPPLAAQAFVMEGNVKGTPSQLSVPDIAVALGDMRGQGAFALGTGQRTTIQLALNLGRIDLDKLLAQATAPPPAAAAAKAPPAAVPPTAAAPGSPIPPTLVAAIDIGVEAIAYRGQAMQQARLTLEVVNGVATVKQLGARLPAGSNILVANLPLPLGGQAPAIPDGRVEAHSDNLRGLLEWLGGDLSSIPAGRVGRFDLKASVRSDGKTVQIANLDSTLDSSRLTGGVSMAWRGRPGFGVRANLDRINLDAYLPPASAKAKPAAAPAAAAGNPLQALETFDLDLVAEIGTLTYRDTPIQGVKLAMDLVGGRLTVKELSARDLAGAQAELKLTADKLATDPAFSTAYSLRAQDARRLIKFASGADAPPAAAGALSLTGTATGTRDALKIDTSMQGLGGQAKIAGSLAQLTQQAPKVDLGIDASFPELGPVLLAFAGGAAKQGQQKLGPVSLKSHLANTGPDSIALKQTELRAFGGVMTMDGTVGKLLTPEPSVDLSMNLNLPSLRPLLTAFNPDQQLMATADQLGALIFAGKAVGSARKMTLRDAAMSGLGGSVKLNGDVLDAGRRYDLNADIQNFNIGPLMAALPGPVMTAAGAKQLGPMTGKLAIKGALDNLSVNMQNLAMRGFGGTMALNGGITDAADPTRKLDLTFDIDKVELGQMMAAFPAAGASPALAAGLKTATIKGAVKGAGTSPSLTLNPATVQAFGGTIAVNGTVTDASSPAAKYDLTASANVPSLYQLLSAFYRPAMQMSGPLAFNNVKLVGDGKRVQITNLVGTLGPVGVSAQGFFTLDGKRPKLDMELKTSGDVFIDAFMPADAQKRTDIMPYWRMLFPDLLPAADERGIQLAQTQAAPAPAPAPYQPVQIAAPPPANAPVDARWSRVPFNVEALKAYDANLRLSGVQSVRFKNYALQNLTGLVTVVDGVMNITKIAGQVFGGALAGDIAFNANNIPRGDLHLTLTRANAAELMKAVANNDKIEGWLSTDAKFQFQGRNEAEMVSTLTGGAALQGDVKARLSGAERLLVGGTQGLGGLLGGTVDSVSQTLTTATGGMSSGLIGALSMVGLLMVDEPGKVSGFVDFKNGLMTERNLQIVNSKVLLVTHGWVSLPVYRQDFAIEAYNRQAAPPPAGQAQPPYIAVQLRGPLDEKRNVRVYGERVQRGVSAGGPLGNIQDILKGKVPGLPGTQTAPAPTGTTAPATTTKPSTADQFKGLLDVLTKPKQ